MFALKETKHYPMLFRREFYPELYERNPNLRLVTRRTKPPFSLDWEKVLQPPFELTWSLWFWIWKAAPQTVPIGRNSPSPEEASLRREISEKPRSFWLLRKNFCTRIERKNNRTRPNRTPSERILTGFFFFAPLTVTDRARFDQNEVFLKEKLIYCAAGASFFKLPVRIASKLPLPRLCFYVA